MTKDKFFEKHFTFSGEAARDYSKREIKFRLFDKVAAIMVYQDNNDHWSLNLDGSLFYGNAQFSGQHDALNYPVILMQYTGLDDANGKEIYEGDIIRSSLIPKPSVVVYRGGSFCFHRSGGLFQTFYESKTEVIGNVYENPELLQSEE